MYSELYAEMARKGFTLEKMVEALHNLGVDMTIQTLCFKRKGKNIFTLDEAKAIKKALGSDLPLEELFAVGD